MSENDFYFDTIGTDDKIIKHSAFIGSNDVHFLFASGQKNVYYMLYQQYVTYNLIKNEKMETAEVAYDYLLEKMRNQKDLTMVVKM